MSYGSPLEDCAAPPWPALASDGKSTAPKSRKITIASHYVAWRMNVDSNSQEQQPMSNLPAPPVQQLPQTEWKHRALYDRVRETLYALPAYFRPETLVAGLLATDIFALNSALGATIEAEVVDGLNDLRTTWDPKQEYAQYSFVRQTQTFPDVRLQRFRDGGTVDIIFGIELKGWYLLAKEGEPSFRFSASPDACAPADLLAVFPWALANVISGRPHLFRPFVVPARYAAEKRNYHWEHEMGGENVSRPIVRAVNARPYPSKKDEIADHARNDAGHNFPRLARTGVMDDYKLAIDQEGISGIPVGLWRKFFKAFVSTTDATAVDAAIDRLVTDIQGRAQMLSEQQIQAIRNKLLEIANLLA